jgi:hypothetical protein
MGQRGATSLQHQAGAQPLSSERFPTIHIKDAPGHEVVAHREFLPFATCCDDVSTCEEFWIFGPASLQQSPFTFVS